MPLSFTLAENKMASQEEHLKWFAAEAVKNSLKFASNFLKIFFNLSGFCPNEDNTEEIAINSV